MRFKIIILLLWWCRRRARPLAAGGDSGLLCVDYHRSTTADRRRDEAAVDRRRLHLPPSGGDSAPLLPDGFSCGRPRVMLLLAPLRVPFITDESGGSSSGAPCFAIVCVRMVVKLANGG